MALPAFVQWHEESTAHLVVGRGRTEGTKKRSPGRSRLVRDVAKAMTKVMGAGWTGLTVPPDLAGALPVVLAAAQSPDPRAPLSIEQEVLSYGIVCLFPQWNQFARVRTQSTKLVRKWFYLGGAAFAVRTLSRAVNLRYAGSWQMTADQTLNLKAGGAFEEAPLNTTNIDHHKRDGPAYALAFRTLRELLASATDTEYAEAVAAGEVARETASLTLRAWLTFAMPTQSAWAARDAADMLKRDPVPPTYVLLMDAVPDVHQGVLMHSRQQRPHHLALNALLSHHGEEAAPALLALAKQAGADKQHLMYWWALDALAQLPTPEVVAFLVEAYAAGEKQEHKRIAHVFQAAPEVALPALQARVGDHPTLQAPLNALLRANPALNTDAAPLSREEALPPLLRTPPSGKPPPAKDWELGRLPQLRLVGSDSVLSPEAMMALGHALHASKGERSAALEAALQAIEPADRVALADTLWKVWSEGHSHWVIFLSARKWLGLAQGLLGNDAVAERIATEVGAWSGRRYNQGKACLVALQTIGTDGALRQVHVLSKTAKSKGIRKSATQALQAAAARRSVSVDALIAGWPAP